MGSRSNEPIRSREGWQVDDVAFCQKLHWTLVIIRPIRRRRRSENKAVVLLGVWRTALWGRGVRPGSQLRGSLSVRRADTQVQSSATWHRVSARRLQTPGGCAVHRRQAGRLHGPFRHHRTADGTRHVATLQVLKNPALTFLWLVALTFDLLTPK